MANETKSLLEETMETENSNGVDTATNGKRLREEEDEGISKKLKAEESVEEAQLEKRKGGEDEVRDESDRAKLGPKSFGSSEDMFDYFYKFLHYWPPNLDVNKYEQMGLLDLLRKGHAEPDKKIGGGIRAFQVRYHPMWKSRCFFLIREDETVDDFSFRKCVDHILPLPEDMKIKSDVNKALGGSRGKRRGGRGGGGGDGGGRGWRGKGGKSRY